MKVFLAFIMAFPAIAWADRFDRPKELYYQGSYQATVKALEEITPRIPKGDRRSLGLAAYWKGMALNRLQQYEQAISAFHGALAVGFVPIDLHYELGQALFAIERLGEAREHFRESVVRGFKPATSMYYVGYIEEDLGELDAATVTFRNLITRRDVGDIKQAVLMKLADISADRAEREGWAVSRVKAEVMPAYELAKDAGPDSNLAPRIQEKIVALQKKYDLVLFLMSNGRPTVFPRHFLRAAQEIGFDSNVTFAPTETTIAKAKQGSSYSKSEVFGKYAFYPAKSLSLSPELRFNSTRYFNRVPQIFRNDNFLVAPSLRSSFEHKYKGSPASFLVDYDFTEAHRDVNARETLVFSSRSHALTLGERAKFFTSGESTFRIRYRSFQSFLQQSNSTTLSVVGEHLASLSAATLILYSSLDHTKVRNSAFDTNALMARADFLFPEVRFGLQPSIGLGLTFTDPVNNRTDRGLEKGINPSARVSKSFGKVWRSNLRLEHQRNESKDKKNFAYQKNVVALELEAVF